MQNQPAASLPTPTPQTVLHRHGGIVTVTGIGHTTRKGVADWYFVGDVQWTDGTGGTSKGTEIAPTCIVYESPDEEREVTRLLGLLNDYLCEHGEWHEPKSKRDGRVYSWTPKEPNGRAALGAS